MSSAPRDRHPETGLPMTTLVCHRCRYVSGHYLTSAWTWRPGTGWLCPHCAARRTWLQRLLRR